MEDLPENRRLLDLLSQRDRTIQKLRQSMDLKEVWGLYQEFKALSMQIESIDAVTVSSNV